MSARLWRQLQAVTLIGLDWEFLFNVTEVPLNLAANRFSPCSGGDYGIQLMEEYNAVESPFASPPTLIY